MKWKSSPFCELCCVKLVGIAEIDSSVEADETVVVTVRESRVIDWIFCRSCRAIVCRASCADSRTGLCKACASDHLIVSGAEINFCETSRERKLTDDILSADIVF